MKYLILFALLLCAQVVYGQDLIVTTTGDSLYCKILDVNADEIQFRFGRSGNVISIRRDETVMHRYNFKSASSSAKSKKTKTGKSDRGETDRGDIYVALWSGARTFGKMSAGDVSAGGAFVLGTDVAYFFNPSLGAGLKVNIANCDVNFSDDYFYYRDRVMFFGPAVHGRWNKGKLSLNANLSVGGLNWQLSNLRIDGASKDGESVTGIGGILSAGVFYTVIQRLGVGLNVQSVLGSLKTDDYERKPTSIGLVLGVNYRF